MMLPIVMVSVIALAMAVCSSTISATQFAIYMSVANLGSSIGSKFYGLVADSSSYVQSYTLLGVLAAVMIAVLFFHRHQHEEDQTPGGTRKVRRRYTAGLGGAEAGAFVSGAMRCPKCRADMEQIDYEGTEIDRCVHCNGMWFDVGEIEVMRDKQAAATIDVGDTKVGKRSDRIDSYDCPRCSGAMTKVVDERQPHIGFETCNECQGSFLDAGELVDLANVTLSDFFKKLAAKRT
jgi:Zn-finger nucleic acid-binding protein